MATDRAGRHGLTVPASVVVGLVALFTLGASAACAASDPAGGAPRSAAAAWAEPSSGSSTRTPDVAPTSSATAVAAPICPKIWGQLEPVPAEPTDDTDGRLVPTTMPAAAMLCSYLGENSGPQTGLPLTRSRVLSGDLSGVPEDLAYLPAKIDGQERPCTAMGGPQTDYLLALDYPDGGRVWVSGADEPNSCVGTGNGVFESSTSTGGLLTAVLKAGRWPASKTTTRPGRECEGGGGGRSGQEQQMVPDGVVEVWVCRTEGTSSSVAHLSDDFGDLVGAMNALPTRPSTSSCHETSFDGWTGPGKPPLGTSYDMLFGYPHGPPVRVTVMPTCVPAIDNGSLQAVDADTLIPLLERALG